MVFVQCPFSDDMARLAFDRRNATINQNKYNMNYILYTNKYAIESLFMYIWARNNTGAQHGTNTGGHVAATDARS